MYTLSDPVLDLKFEDYSRRFLELMSKYREANPDRLATTRLQMVLVAALVLRKEVENPDNENTTWEGPRGMLRWRVNVDKELNPQCIHLDPAHLQDRRVVAGTMIGHFAELKVVDFLQQETLGVVITRSGGECDVLCPRHIQDRLLAQLAECGGDKDWNLLDPVPASLEFTLRFDAGTNDRKETRGSFQVRFLPLVVDGDRDMAFYPIDIRLLLPDCSPECWSDETKAKFWKLLIDCIKSLIPNEDKDFLGDLISDLKLVPVT